jgi:hypothetical protein
MSGGFHYCGSEVRLNIMVGSMWWSKAPHLMVNRKQRDRESTGGTESGQDTATKDTPPSDLLPPVRPHLLMFTLPPKTAPPRLQSLWGTFYIQIITLLTHKWWHTIVKYRYMSCYMYYTYSKGFNATKIAYIEIQILLLIYNIDVFPFLRQSLTM